MKFFLLLLSFLCIRQTKAQTYVLIPDAMFATYLQIHIPTAMNGNSLNITSTLVTTGTQTISVFAYNISNLSGVQYFTSLQSLNCDNNFLTTLPALPNSLTDLFCSNNSLTTLPSLPNLLQQLDCSGNSITTLPALPNSLQTLYCVDNSITTLPALPNSLQILSCSANSLTSLPALPVSLQILYCEYNSLASLPALPNSLQTLYCDNNHIVCFPFFPSSITSIDLYVNPYTCLPNIVLPAMNAYINATLCAHGNTNGCAYVGIKELSTSNNDISLYPNPANDFLYLSSNAGMEYSKASIINGLGQLIAEAEWNYTNKKTAFNIKDLPNGVYSLLLRAQSGSDDSQTVSKKRFVVAH